MRATPPSPHPSHNEERLLQNMWMKQPGNIANEIQPMTISSSCTSSCGNSSRSSIKRIERWSQTSLHFLFVCNAVWPWSYTSNLPIANSTSPDRPAETLDAPWCILMFDRLVNPASRYHSPVILCTRPTPDSSNIHWCFEEGLCHIFRTCTYKMSISKLQLRLRDFFERVNSMERNSSKSK